MKKAGIITYHNAENYGAALQTFALQKTLEKIGLNCIIIDYRNFGVTKRNFIKNCFYFFTFQRPLRNIRGYKAFRQKYFNLSKSIYRNKQSFQNDTDYYDYLFFGSDQIWNPDLSNGFDEIYFGMFDSKSKKIAYSASVGRDIIPDDDLKKINKYLNNFDAVSVREDSIVNSLQGDVSCVLDPCFLLSDNEWCELIPDQDRGENYILVYQLHLNRQIQNIAEFLGCQLNKKVYLLSPDISRNRKIIKKIKSTDPISFLRYFHDADFVITDSFHGTAFSILFHKLFYSVLPPQKKGRIITLLDRLGLNDRIISNVNEININIEKNEGEINYKKVDKLLEKEKKSSMDFIKSNLI